MKFITLTFVILFKFNSFSQNISNEIKIISKYEVMNIATPPYHYTHCHGDIKPFKETSKYHCTFYLSEKQITLRSKYVLDDNGKITEYWRYGTEGVIISSIDELQNDRYLYPRYKNIKIEILKNNIIDTGEKIEIVKIFKDEKLILGNINSKKVLYEYR